MRIFLACIMAAALLVINGCGAAAQPADVEETPQAVQEEALNVEETARGRPVQANRNTQTGKIVSISENEITVELAAFQTPEWETPGDIGERPQRNGEFQGERRRPEDSRPEGGPRSDEGGRGNPDGRAAPEGGFPNGGRGFGGQTELTYSGEQKTYALSEGLKITKGVGDNSEAITVTDLAKDDVVRLELDESGALISIYLWSVPEDAGANSADAQ